MSKHSDLIGEWMIRVREEGHAPASCWFRRSVVAAVCRAWAEDGGPYDDDDEGASRLDPKAEVSAEIRVVPDAYYIDYESRLICVLEAAVSHGWNESKSRRYSSLWWFLDCEGWTLRVVEVDRWNNERDRDLMSEFYAGSFGVKS